MTLSRISQRASNSNRTKDVLAGLGFSNLILSHNLAVLLTSGTIYIAREAQRDYLWSWLLSMCLLSGVAYALIQLYRSKTWARLPLIVLSILTAIPAVYEFQLSIGLHLGFIVVGLGVLWILGARLFIGGKSWVEQLYRLPRTIGLSYRLSAFYAATCVASAIWGILHVYYAPTFDHAAGPDSHPPIVWVVFDELDQSWLFDHRPKDVQLPEFDAFRHKSVTFTNAQRPGPETLISVPALTIGRAVKNALPDSPSELQILFPDGRKSHWSKEDSIFDEMHRLKRSSAIVGFYHNYGAIFANKASHIRSEAFNFFGILPSVEFQMWLFFPELPRFQTQLLVGDSSFEMKAEIAEHKAYLARQLADMRHAIEDWRCGFIFLHIGLPHAPWIGAPNDTTNEGYLKNLVLTDDFLKQIRMSLERAGTWESATVLVTADHNFRQPLYNTPRNQKVPLMVKLPHQQRSLEVTDRVESIDERWLLEAIARSEVRAPERAAEFMKAHVGGGHP